MEKIDRKGDCSLSDQARERRRKEVLCRVPPSFADTREWENWSHCALHQICVEWVGAFLVFLSCERDTGMNAVNICIITGHMY